MRIRFGILFAVFALFVSVALCGCGKTEDKKEEVRLNVWSSSEDKEIIMNAAEEFEKEHADEADIQIDVMIENISGSKKMVLSDTENSADIYSFVDDQFVDLYNSGALMNVSRNVTEVCEASGGMDADIVKKVTVDGEVYGYPLSDSNGYFLYYNSDYFTEEDVKDLDRILEIAQENGKYFAMDWSSGWYMYSFFGGAGKTIAVTDDGQHNVCDFADSNGKYAGIDIVNSLLDISRSKGFRSAIDEKIVEGIKNGEIIAAVNGTWNTSVFEDAWGDAYNADKLPKFTINGEKVQMASFYGYKYFGINPHSKNKEWAMRLAEKITDYDVQMERFAAIGEGPANVKAKESEKVKNSKAIMALENQKEYAIAQNVCEAYWNPMSLLGAYLASGNPDNVDMQQLLDKTVREINE